MHQPGSESACSEEGKLGPLSLRMAVVMVVEEAVGLRPDMEAIGAVRRARADDGGGRGQEQVDPTQV